MKLLQQLVPINLEEEKSKFFEDQTYNPQFIYHPEANFEDRLYKYGLAKPEVLKKAQQVVDQAYNHRNERDLMMMEGNVVSQREVTQKIEAFLKLHNLEKKYEISWSASYVARISITANRIKLSSTVDFRKEGLLGALFHEIGTHALRQVNYEQQPWYKQKKKNGFHEYLRTEEGLAVLHSLLPKSFQSPYSSAIVYLAVAYAQQHSFVQLWEYLSKYVGDHEKRWGLTLRQKRGLTDTSQPGGFTKGLVYFEGVLQVARWLDQHQYNITPLYFGKLALEDVDKALKMNPSYKPVLPSFYLIDPQDYAKQMAHIVKSNNLHTKEAV